MESTLSIKHSSLRFSNTRSPLFPQCIHTRRFSQTRIVSPIATAVSDPKRLRRRLQCVSSSAVYSSGGGGGGLFGGDDGSSGGGGGEGTGGGDSEAKLGAGVADDLSALSPDVIVLDVGGMSCGGCVASVKRILESQGSYLYCFFNLTPQVSSASVDLATETAIVWPVPEAKVVPNWQKELGDALAKQLTSCGFKSSIRGEEAIEGDVSP